MTTLKEANDNLYFTTNGKQTLSNTLHMEGLTEIVKFIEELDSKELNQDDSFLVPSDTIQIQEEMIEELERKRVVQNQQIDFFIHALKIAIATSPLGCVVDRLSTLISEQERLLQP